VIDLVRSFLHHRGSACKISTLLCSLADHLEARKNVDQGAGAQATAFVSLGGIEMALAALREDSRQTMPPRQDTTVGTSHEALKLLHTVLMGPSCVIGPRHASLLLTYVITTLNIQDYPHETHSPEEVLLTHVVEACQHAALLRVFYDALEDDRRLIVPLSLMESPSQRVRVDAIRLWSSLYSISTSTVRQEFQLSGGFAAMCEALGAYPPDSPTIGALCILIVGRTPQQDVANDASVLQLQPSSSPEALEVLCFVLRKTTSFDLIHQAFDPLLDTISSASPPQTTATTSNTLITSILSQEMWISWFHGLGNTLYVRGFDEREASSHPFIRSHQGGSSTTTNDSLAHATDEYLSPVYEMTAFLLQYVMRLETSEARGHLQELFSLSDGQVSHLTLIACSNNAYSTTSWGFYSLTAFCCVSLSRLSMVAAIPGRGNSSPDQTIAE